ncbi:hypothetical protein WQ54_19320 [Bacillus sp. SA1-12]|nr:hypothetical protein WQ54_19320 [Bacillus sp. SA1-12]
MPNNSTKNKNWSGFDLADAENKSRIQYTVPYCCMYLKRESYVSAVEGRVEVDIPVGQAISTGREPVRAT